MVRCTILAIAYRVKDLTFDKETIIARSSREVAKPGMMAGKSGFSATFLSTLQPQQVIVWEDISLTR